jgi:flagellar hook-associated protein FlgK
VNETWEVVVVGSGLVGATDGLRLEVRSSTVLATIDIGTGYTPSSLTTAVEGLQFVLGPGEVQDGDRFFVDVVADPDTAGLLTGLGLNTLFTGSTARDLAVRESLLLDPGGLATSRTHDAGDASGALAFVTAANAEGSDGLQPFERASGVFERLGRTLAEVRRAGETNNSLLRSVEARQASLSGVSLDEEAANLVKLERAYSASAKVIAVVQQLDQVLFNLVR